jgi:hypothetical protein
MASGTTAILSGVWGSAAGDVWVVGVGPNFSPGVRTHFP